MVLYRKMSHYLMKVPRRLKVCSPQTCIDIERLPNEIKRDIYSLCSKGLPDYAIRIPRGRVCRRFNGSIIRIKVGCYCEEQKELTAT